MDCDQALGELEAYLDDELPQASRRRVEEHLFGCQDCFDRGEFRRQVREIVGRKCGIRADVPAGVAERIRRMLGSEA
jgi:anti-sigma factor (TIGR02949 family)